MNLKQPLLIGLSLLTLTACMQGTSTDTGNDSSSAASSIGSDTEETRNVLYRGRLEDAGVSIFMQGTHKLTLDDGRFILLESEDVNLDRYVDMNVEVFGSVRPTVEAGGMIMRVESVKSLEESSMSSSVSSKAFCGGIAGFACPDGQVCVDDPSDSCDPMNGGADCGGMCIPASQSSQAVSDATSSRMAASSAVASSIAASSVAQASSVAPTTSSVAWEASDDLSAKAAIMAKDKMGAEFWTQRYCSTQSGFCFPVHKNWWYQSFGATTSALLHIEIAPSELNNLGDGPLTVRLVSGDIAAAGKSDGQVTSDDGMSVGYRAWTNGRHIEVRGPSNLDAAVRYITAQIAATGS